MNTPEYMQRITIGKVDKGTLAKTLQIVRYGVVEMRAIRSLIEEELKKNYNGLNSSPKCDIFHFKQAL